VGIPFKNDRGARQTIIGVTKAVLIPLRVLNLKRSTAEAFELDTFQGIEPKKYKKMMCRFRIGTS